MPLTELGLGYDSKGSGWSVGIKRLNLSSRFQNKQVTSHSRLRGIYIRLFTAEYVIWTCFFIAHLLSLPAISPFPLLNFYEILPVHNMTSHLALIATFWPISAVFSRDISWTNWYGDHEYGEFVYAASLPVSEMNETFSCADLTLTIM